jgi:YVTN family beta-propeller protein
MQRRARVFCGALSMFSLVLSTVPAGAAQVRTEGVGGAGGGPAFLPTGQYITATVARGATYQRLRTGFRADGNADADSAMSSATSPDGKSLLVLTSGFNVSFNHPDGSPLLFPVLSPLTGLPAKFTNRYTGQPATAYNQAEILFVFDISHGTPTKIQQITIPDTYSGLAWEPNGQGFYVSGGVDDRVLVYRSQTTSTGASYVPDPKFIILKHNSEDYQPLPMYDGGILKNTIAGQEAPLLVTGAVVSGIDVSKDGKTLVAANFENASASIVDTASRFVTSEVHFYMPGGSVGHGEFPYGVAVLSDPVTGRYKKAYVTSQREDEVDVISGNAFSKIIPVPAGPNKMALSSDGRYLYVACGNADKVAVIDTSTDTLFRAISVSRPGDPFKGANPNSIAIGGNHGNTLYVTLGGENAVAVIDLKKGQVIGRIPTGWLPTSVTLSPDGSEMYVVNEKSNGGPNPGQTYYSWNTPYGISLNKTAQNNYTWAIEKGGLLSLPTPRASELSYLSNIVDANNGFGNRPLDPMMAFLQKRIKHVIYIVNENRTFDQVLGDIGNGANGDPRITFFTQPITPNLHALARDYVTLDNFYDSAETSGVGWNWSMQGHTNDFVEKTQPVQYGNSNGLGLTYDWQGIVAHMNLGLPATGGSTIFDTRITGILDPSGSSTILPGPKDPSATVGANDLSANTIGGYIWESALRAGKTIRNYGWQIDLTYYGSGTPFDPPMVRHPYPNYLQSAASTPSIRAATDPYYRAFDQRYPDIFRIEEWKREFANYVKSGNLPNLEVMTIPHDHTGSFGSAIEGLGTPELELSDHDYAIGQLVDTVTHSPYWATTAIVMIEDDPQNGQDHVEAHRSIAHIISPYTKSHYLDHSTYVTVDALRTVEDLLGIQHLGLQDANAIAMSDVFTNEPNLQGYRAIIPGSLCKAPVAPDLVPECASPYEQRTRPVPSRHNSTWWNRATASLDFTKPDAVPPQIYNQILEYGITGRGSMPSRSETAAAGLNLGRDY